MIAKSAITRTYGERQCWHRDCPKPQSADSILQRCSQCKEALYCGPSCQRSDWIKHKKICQSPEAQNAPLMHFGFEGLSLTFQAKKSTDGSVTTTLTNHDKQQTYETTFTTSDIAIAYHFLGKRTDLRKKVIEDTFPLSVLAAHTYLMIRCRNSMQGFLWKAEKNGHSVSLIGVCHNFLDLRLKPPNSNKLRTIPLHPQIEQAVANGSTLFVEFDAINNPQSQIILNQELERLQKDLTIRTSLVLPGSNTHKIPDIDINMGSIQPHSLGMDTSITLLKPKEHVQSLENIQIQTNVMSKVVSCEQNVERALETLDAAQWGTLLCPFDEIADVCYDRNPNMTKQILQGIENGEDNVYAIGFQHYPGEKGILASLEAEGVTITRTDLR